MDGPFSNINNIAAESPRPGGIADDAPANSPFQVSPAITRPKGGGAIRGIGEKFDMGAATGTGRLTVPIMASPGRSGFGPRLTLAYDSGGPAGAFGLGWSVDLPAVTRKTDRGLPRYDDARESDEFVLSGAEDLVPVTDPAARPASPRRLHRARYDVTAYRPRIEGVFARIERWVDLDAGTSHWRTIGRDNVTTLYGIDEQSRIHDPADPLRVFSYLIRRTFDDRGNVTVFEYSAEDARGVRTGSAHEANRTGRAAGRYLKRVRYGNATPYHPTWAQEEPEPPLPGAWHFSLVFDYGDHDDDAPAPEPSRPWPVRPDPFSSHRPGFELRTYRRCRRILLFHDFPGEPSAGADLLVRSTDLVYADETAPPRAEDPVHSLLASVTQAGYRRTGDGYLRRAMPPLEFEYEPMTLSDDPRTPATAFRGALPEGLDGTRFQLVDLDGEGLPGILARPPGGWYYQRNLSPIHSGARFAAPERVTASPAGQDQLRLMDLAGDGRLDAVALDTATPGFFERDREDWAGFRTFEALPTVDFADPNLRFADLTGDGLADILITDVGELTMHRSLGEQGFAGAERSVVAWNERDGPAVLLADGTQTVFLADLTGDGLADLVRVRSADVSYWPSLGYGRFGPRVTMDDAPLLAAEQDFDPRRVRLADIDGSGGADLLYLGRDGVVVCFNRSGNSWARPRRLAVLPSLDDPGAVQTADLLGNGTTCLVWSSSLPDEPEPLLYVDLTGGRKPFLMIRSRNNLGTETRLRYSPSTRYYLADRAAGRPWPAPLPFPVHVVDRVETFDWIGRTRQVTSYTYHDGYFSPDDREFRGFGMVERRDTEELRGDTDFPEAEAVNWAEESWQPPVLTRTWFHTGVPPPGPGGFWVEPALRAPGRAVDAAATRLPGPWFDPLFTDDEADDARRALKGRALRTEVFAEDGSAAAGNPYTVTEETYAVRRLQARGDNRHPVVFVVPRESVTAHYERADGDPRVAHEVTLAVDAFGNVLRTAAVSYPRRPGPAPEGALPFFGAALVHDQARLHVLATEHRYTRSHTDPRTGPDVNRTPLESETIVAELTGIAPAPKGSGITDRFGWAELDGYFTTLWSGTADIPYEEIPAADVDGSGTVSAVPSRRIVKHSRTRYRADDLTGLLALHDVGTLALPGEAYRLALTKRHLGRVFGTRVTDAALTGAGYVRIDASGSWWMPSGRVYYSTDAADPPAVESARARAHFYRARRATDPLGGTVVATQDDYTLLEITATDAVGNVMEAVNDYRVLCPSVVVDANGNRSEYVYDAMARVVGVAGSGRPAEHTGDTLDGFDPDPDEAVLLAHLDDPLDDPGALLAGASSRMVYDVGAFWRTRDDDDPRPACVHTITRDTHDSDAGIRPVLLSLAFTYSDGQGRPVQRRVRAERERTPLGRTGPVRWAASGWAIFDNKGNAVRSFEPFFSPTHRFEFDVPAGVSSVRCYDPAGRCVAVLHPDDTWEKVVFDTWRKEVHDANDTVAAADPRDDPDVGANLTRLLGAATPFTSWYDRRIAGALGATPQERDANADAASKAARHAGTYTVEHADARGRTCLTVADEGGGRRHACRTAVDVEGNPLAVFDQRGRRVLESCVREPVPGGGLRYVSGHDIAGNLLYRNGIDDGSRWTLPDVAGNTVLAWDALGHAFRTRYDAALRPTHRYVRTGTGPESLASRIVYGEGLPADRKLAGRVHRTYDAAGVDIVERCDFKGNIVESAHQFPYAYRTGVDWSVLETITKPADLDAAAPLLDPAELYVTRCGYDALNRPLRMTAPHRTGQPVSVLQVSYSEAGLADAVAAWVRRPTEPAGPLDPATADVRAVTAIDYDARGRRGRVELGNGTVTTYDYDPLNLRLARLRTERPGTFPADRRTVQDLRYFHDPAGNITGLHDLADLQNVVFFANRRVEPSADYTYDALYRLTAATGREHVGQRAGGLGPLIQVNDDDGVRARQVHPADGKAVGCYTETYEYDAAGNLEKLRHEVGQDAWVRRYRYAEASAIDPAETGNRLSATSVPADAATGGFSAAYAHDGLGSMTAMPHLPSLTWDEYGRLRSTTRQVVTNGTPETTWHVHDGAGDRMRKVTDAQAPAGVDPPRTGQRLYLGPIEIHRRYDSTGQVSLERETLHVAAGADRITLVETRTAGTDRGLAQAVRYQYTNHLDSSLLELDPAAAVITYEEYHPYGSTALGSTRDLDETPKRYRYTGRERDDESDLYHDGARFYVPWLGRWTAADPAGIADGLNTYAYVSGNPVQLRDPSGTEGVHDDEAGVCRPEYPTCSRDSPAGAMSVPPATSIREVGRTEAAASRAPPEDEYDLSAYDDPSADSEPGALERLWEAAKQNETVQLLAGVAHGTAIGAAPGGFIWPIVQDAKGWSDDLPPAFRFGQGAGEAAWGVFQFGGALFGEAVGIGLDFTGVGAAIGVPVNVIAAGVALEAAGDMVVGTAVAMKAHGDAKRQGTPTKVKTLKQHRAGNRQVEANGRRYHLPEGADTSKIPKVDKVGDQLQNEVSKAAGKWNNTMLSANERLAINKAFKEQKPWLARLLENQAKGRFIHEEVKAAAKNISSTLKASGKGVDFTDTASGFKYEVLSGTTSNLDLHALRMAKDFFRMLTF